MGIIKDVKGTIDYIDVEQQKIGINESHLNLNNKQTYVANMKKGDTVLFGYDDVTNNLMFIKLGEQKAPAQNPDALTLIAKHLEHINWNMGKIVAHLEGNKDLKKELDEHPPQ